MFDAIITNLAFDIATLKHIALFICLGVFLVVIAWLLLSRSGSFDRDARIPLDDENVTTPREDGEEEAQHNGNRDHG